MKNQLKTILLLGLLSTLLVGAGALVGKSALVVAVVLALVMNVGAYFWSDRIVLAMHRARVLEPHELPWLHAMVADLARQFGIPMPRVAVLPSAQPNAFATGRNPEHAVVAVTEGILDLLSERELRAVLAHELAHVDNRDVLVATVAAATAGATTTLAHVLSMAFMFGGSSDDDEGSPAAGILVALVAPIAAMLLQLGVSRSREYLADETAARITGDPRALASALAKLERGAHLLPGGASPATASLFIVNPLSGAQGLMHLFSTHPPIQERIERLLALEPTAVRPRVRHAY